MRLVIRKGGRGTVRIPKILVLTWLYCAGAGAQERGAAHGEPGAVPRARRRQPGPARARHGAVSGATTPSSRTGARAVSRALSWGGATQSESMMALISATPEPVRTPSGSGAEDGVDGSRPSKWRGAREYIWIHPPALRAGAWASSCEAGGGARAAGRRRRRRQRARRRLKKPRLTE